MPCPDKREAGTRTSGRRAVGAHEASDKRGEWFDCQSDPQRFVHASRFLKIGVIVEFELLDIGGGSYGLCMAKVIGHKTSSQRGLPLLVVQPLAAERESTASRMTHSLQSPHALHLCQKAARSTDCDEKYLIHRVENFRVRSRESVDEPWAATALPLPAEPRRARPGNKPVKFERRPSSPTSESRTRRGSASPGHLSSGSAWVRGSSATGRHRRASPPQPQRRLSRDASPQLLKKRPRVEDTGARLISMVVTEPPGPAAVAPPSARRTAGPPGEWLSARVIAAAAPRQCEQPGERLVKLKRHDGSPTSGATAASPAAPAPVGVPTPVLSATPCAWPEPLAIVSGGEQGITECHQFEWRFGSGDISTMQLPAFPANTLGRQCKAFRFTPSHSLIAKVKVEQRGAAYGGSLSEP